MPGPYLSQAAFGQYQLPDSDPMVVPADPVPEITIDLWKTRITDSSQGIRPCDFLRSVPPMQPYNGKQPWELTAEGRGSFHGQTGRCPV